MVLEADIDVETKKYKMGPFCMMVYHAMLSQDPRWQAQNPAALVRLFI